MVNVVKVRSTSKDKQIAEFAAKADQSAFDPAAPRGKKRGGADVLLPMNAYESQLLKKASTKDNRSLAGFIRAAAIKEANNILAE